MGLPRELGFRHKTSVTKYEHSSLAFSPVAQLNASLGYLKNVGLSKIEKHAVGLAHEFREGAAKLGYESWTPEGNQSPIVSIIHGRDPDHLKRLLKEESIVITFKGTNQPVLRVAVSLFNNRADIQRILKVLETSLDRSTNHSDQRTAA